MQLIDSKCSVNPKEKRQKKSTAAAAAAVASVVSDSLRPHRWQPTRLPHPWDPPGKNTGVGCHFLLQCIKVKSESEVAHSCPTLRDPRDCSLPGSSVHGIFQATGLEWGATAFSTIEYYSAIKKKEIGNMGKPMADSYWCLVEINAIL